MELVYSQAVGSHPCSDQVLALLAQADREFMPPLSSRGSTTQQQFSLGQTAPEGVVDYYRTMAQQPAVLAIEDGQCLGFMAFKIDYSCPQSPGLPNLYASTCVVAPAARGQGLMKAFYEKMIALFPGYRIFTRTWHTNYAHLKVLQKLGFQQTHRLADHRGPGLDTVYYARQ